MQAWFACGKPDEVTVLHNGVDLKVGPYPPVASGGLVWSGRISANNGPHLAWDAARLLGKPIHLYGPIDDLSYWEGEIAPRLGEQAVYGGHLTSPELAAALGAAELFLFTPLWDEPFGLAAVEAMACGLPVAAFDMGAAREVVGPAGVMACDLTAVSLAGAARAAMTISRRVARRQAETFSMELWLDRCETLYRSLRP